MFRFHVKNRLAAYLHGELKDRAAHRVERHLRRCASCRTRLEAIRRADTAASEMPLVGPDEDLWRTIASSLASKPAPSAKPIGTVKSGVSWLPRFSYAAALAILVTLGWLWLQSDLPASEDSWPQWRGQNQDGKAVKADLQLHAGFKLRVLWKRPLGSGYSSVSVANGRAVTMYSDSTFDFVAAFDAKNGEPLWQFKIDSTYRGHDGSHDGPMSTPLLAEEKVYTVAPRGQLLCLDARNGEKVWFTHLVKDHSAVEPFYGFATSPILDGGVLIVESGGDEGTISGFKSSSGELLWSTGNDSVNYHSPVRFRFAGQTQLLCASNNYLYGLEPGRGRILWSYQHNGRGETINPVVVEENQIFIRQSWEKNSLLQLKRENRRYVARKVWDNSNLKGSYDTPIYHEGYLYGFSGRLLKCVDATSGESVWKSPTPGDGFTIFVDDHLIILTKQGTLHAVRANPDRYEEIASLQLFDSQVWTPPSSANGRIYARSLGQIACVEIVRGEQVDLPDLDSGWDDAKIALVNH